MGTDKDLKLFLDQLNQNVDEKFKLVKQKMKANWKVNFNQYN